MIGVFGGNFDPPHTGHLILAQDAVNMLGIDKVIFIPAWISPFKEDIIVAPFKHRYEMLKLATGEKSFLDVLDIESERKGISYTYDTLVELREKYDSLCLLIGEDQAHEFKKWYKWKKIIEMVDVYVFRRGEGRKDYPEGLNPLDTRRIDISSTEIRESIKQGKKVDFLIPDKVLEYIEKNGLYR